MKPYRRERDGVLLAVRLTPRAARNGIDGVVADADGRPLLKIRLTAPPVDGEANAALIDFLAGALQMRKAAIAIRSGHTGRTKMVLLNGDGDGIVGALDGLLAARP